MITKGFYTALKCYNVYKKCNSSTSLHEALSNREFKVTDLGEAKGYQRIRRVFKLEDTTNGEVLYYDYDPTISTAEYSFEVKGGPDLPADFYCDYVESMYSNPEHIRHKFEQTGLFLLKKVTYEGKTSTKLTFMRHSAKFAGK